MSPEQARGKAVDRRTDIWAFGCVLNEMLTGRRTFDGESVADVLAAVMTREPDLASLPVVTPERVAWVIRRCLQKDPRRRLRDIGDALAEVEAAPASSSPPSETTRAATSRTARALPWALAAAGVLFGLATIFVGRRDPSPTVPRLVQVEVKTEEASRSSLIRERQWCCSTSQITTDQALWLCVGC
jgi:eukaryotic-like serine/threonine-protein kinase